MHHERHPTRRSLDKAEFQLRKLFWNFVMYQITKRKQRLNAAMAERVISVHIEEIQKQRTTGSSVDQNRQIRVTGRLVNRIEIRVIQRPLSLDAAKENTHCAVVFAPLDFLDRLFDRVERRHHDPSHAPARLSASLGKKSVVRAPVRYRAPNPR